MKLSDNDYSKYTDEELIKKIRQGDDKVIDYLLDKYKPLVRKQCNALFIIGAENEDLIQEGMIGLFKAVRDYKDDKESTFFNFARICINRQLYSAIQASNRQKHLPLNSYISISDDKGDEKVALEDILLIDNLSPEQLVLEQERKAEFEAKIEKELSTFEKKVLTFYLEGYNYVQIADIIKKKPKSIDNALQRIRQKVRNVKVGD